ncbi:MAG: NAD(P)-dependent oxidoreductase [Thermoproteota archaeon]
MPGALGKTRPKCLITATFTEKALSRLSQRVEVIYEDWRRTGRIYFGDELTEKIIENNVEILVVEADQVTADTINKTSLRLIGACRGTPYAVDVKAATMKGIPVVYAPGRNSQAVAEMTIGLMLALLRKIVYAQRRFARGVRYETDRDFQEIYNALQGGEIHGKKVGIIGLGDIGTRVAKILVAFGASILVYDPYVPNGKIASVGGKKVSLSELLEQSDIITLHVRLTDETYHMIGSREISMMKPTAIIINTSSPGTVDDQALLEALRQGRVAGAALDVQENEPVDSSNPFLELDNVVVTPHIAGNTQETVERQSNMIVEDLNRFLEGDKPLHLLNPEVYEKA